MKMNMILPLLKIFLSQLKTKKGAKQKPKQAESGMSLNDLDARRALNDLRSTPIIRFDHDEQ
jgi:hypothetical protein